MSLWAMFPLVLQAVYAASALPPLLRLHESKRSDQHTVSNHVMTLCAHAAMAVWAHVYAKQPGMVLSTLISMAVSLTFLSTILHYRRWPGGRLRVPRGPTVVRSAPSVSPSLLLDARRVVG